MLPCRSVVASTRTVTSRAEIAGVIDSAESNRIRICSLVNRRQISDAHRLRLSPIVATDALPQRRSVLLEMTPERPGIRPRILAFELLPVVVYVNQLAGEMVRTFGREE